MGFKVITPPAGSLITLPELRLQCHIDDDNTAEDALLTVYLEGARAYCQHYTGCAIGSQMIELAVDAFPISAIDLPILPVTAVISIKYIDASDVEQTLSSTLYTVDDYSSQRHWVLPKSGSAWPIAQAVANAVKVRFVAGDLPGPVKSAMLLLVGESFKNREASVDGQINQIPIGVHALLDTVKAWGV